jgi:hypothetical protein
MEHFLALTGAENEDACIMNYFCGRGTMVVWAKTRGFAPVVTFPVGCNDTVRQVIEPIPETEDVAQVCPLPPAENPCDAQVTLAGPDGASLDAVVWWFPGLDPTSLDFGVLGLLGSGSQYYGDAIKVPAATLLVYGDGHLPRIACLQCGAQTLQLEASPYVWQPSGGCALGRGSEGTNGPPSPSWLLLVAAAALVRRTRYGPPLP